MSTDTNLSPEKIHVCESLAARIERLQEKINARIREMPVSVMDNLDPFVEPRKFAEGAIVFYETLISASETVSSKLEAIRSSISGDEEVKHLASLQKSGFVEHMGAIQECMRALEMYSGFFVVEDFARIHRAQISSRLRMCEESFFYSLRKHAPKCAQEAPVFARFLAESMEKRDFVQRYIDTFYQKFMFKDFEIKGAAILGKVSGMHSTFLEIERTNTGLLGPEMAEDITKMVTEMLMADAKQKTAATLMNVDKRNNPDDIAFVAELYSVLGVPEDRFGPVFSHLSDIKDECLKLASNLLVTLYEAIDLATAPNKFCDAEAFTVSAGRILTAIKRYEEFGRAFVASCPITSSMTCEELLTEVGTKCYSKVVEVSRTISGVRRCIFLINNIYIIQKFLNERDGRDLSEQIRRNQTEIVSVWRRECDVRRGTDITSFLNSNIDIQKRYYLPDPIRGSVKGGVQQIVEESLALSTYKGSIRQLREELQHLFLGR